MAKALAIDVAQFVLRYSYKVSKHTRVFTKSAAVTEIANRTALGEILGVQILRTLQGRSVYRVPRGTSYSLVQKHVL